MLSFVPNEMLENRKGLLEIAMNYVMNKNSLARIVTIAGRGEGVLPYIGFIGLCVPKGYRLSAGKYKFKYNWLRWPNYIFNLIDITKLPCYPH